MNAAGLREHKDPMGLAIALLIALALLPYLETLSHDFINYDDNLYVSENSRVQQGLTLDNTVWAFTTAKGGNWHPVTWLSHMADISLWGRMPAGHHFTNVILHVANTLLVFFAFSQMTGAIWRSALVAGLFAVHPLHVESVAWVAERKDVLSTFFGLLALCAYLKYASAPSIKKYLLVICLFVLGLMAKPMLVSFPFILLALDIWPLRRWKLWQIDDPKGFAPESKATKGILLEKVPLFLIAAIFSLIAVFSQGAAKNISNSEALPFFSRVTNAIVGYVLYLEKLFVPTNLAVFYPHPGHWRLSVVATSALLLFLITAVAIMYRRQFPWLLIGWIWFIITLIPVIGLIQVGWQSIADRYTYIPSIGIFMMAAWSTPATGSALASRASIAIVGLIIAAFSFLTWEQVSYWKNSRTLFAHAAQVTQGNYIAHENLGNALEADKNLDGALQLYRLSANERPMYAKTKIHENIANVLIQQQRNEDALAELRYAVELDPHSSTAFNSMGSIMLIEGRLTDAANYFQTAVQFDPDNLAAVINYGITLVKLGRWNDAIAQLAPVVRAAPDRIMARTYFARALAGRGDFNKAIAELEQILRMKPDFGPARDALRQIRLERGQSHSFSPLPSESQSVSLTT
jgi:protein O-mannosyl-transferase